MVTWFAGLFYLPRLFVYHAMSDDETSNERFKVMERKLFYGIMNPGGVLTILFGLWLIFGWGMGINSGGWFHVKMLLVLILIGYHIYCGRIINDFKHNKNQRGHIFYRWFNEFPVLILIAVVILAVVRPF
jgi:putative membrane protein